MLLVMVLNASAATPPTSGVQVSAIYVNGQIETMNSLGAPAQAVAIKDGKFVGVGSNAEILAKFHSDHIVDLAGATVLPGFIDTHSHAQAWGVLSDPDLWLDLSSVNVFLKPLPGDPRCTDPQDPQKCFIPVTTQEDAISRLTTAVAKAKPGDFVYATLYDPSRLGHGPTCRGNQTKVGFACPNFEDGNARKYLDQISSTVRILVGSQSGHISYVNSAYLQILNICGTDFAKDDCTTPYLPRFGPGKTDPQEEELMANLGQLNEDLSNLAQADAANRIAGKNTAKVLADFQRAIQTYAQNGFTFVQEGAAGEAQVVAYLLASLSPKFPVTAAMLFFNNNRFLEGILKAEVYRLLASGNPNLIIHGIKEFSDGSNQGYTGLLLNGYANLFYPFNDPQIFPYDLFGNPYLGIPDTYAQLITHEANLAHLWAFPFAVHQNGDGAIDHTLRGFQAAKSSNLRDMMIHFSLASPSDLATAKSLDTGVTFLITNLYYYGLPLCQQVLGPQRTAPIYPTGDAQAAGLRFGLHADSPVGAPDVLFMIWVAKTRKTQQPLWYPNLDPNQCPVVLGSNEAISIQQAVKAFTTDAAYVYGLDNEYGSIEAGKFADLVILSDNPLSMENNPDQLKAIRVLGTVHHGRYFNNPHGQEQPIWPD